MKEFFEGGDRIFDPNGAVAVDGLVAVAANDVELGVQGGADEGLEAGLKQVGAEVGFVGLVQAAIALKQPGDGEL